MLKSKRATAQEIGIYGEKLAAKYIKRKGFKVIAKNYRVKGGEIDIIAENKKYIIFAEVKTRSSKKDIERFGRASDAVGEEKKQHLRTAARRYMSENRTDKKPRFDVVEIYLTPLERRLFRKYSAEINYYEEAF